jgi:hypothetical protein
VNAQDHSSGRLAAHLPGRGTVRRFACARADIGRLAVMFPLPSRTGSGYKCNSERTRTISS